LWTGDAGSWIVDRAKRTWSLLRSHFLVAAAAVVVLIFVPFILVSEATIKKILDGWFNDCVLVFDLEVVTGRPNRLLVTGFAQGRFPTVLPVTFSARNAEISSIQLVNPVERSSGTYDSLAVHPQANQTCPGQLCESQGNLPSSVYITVPLMDVHSSFSYQFRVDFSNAVRTENLRVFVQYDPGLKEGVCRVERAHVFNWFFRLSKPGQFLFAVLMFICATVVVAAVRALMKGE
jgi:hypothetical protein